MARHLFGGIADFVVGRGENVTTVDGLAGYQTVLIPNHEVTFWDAPVGGTRVTDLVDASGTPIADGVVITNDEGALPQFYGPDGVTLLYADAGGTRRAILAMDVGSAVATAQAAQVGLAGHEATPNPHQMALAHLVDVLVSAAAAGNVLQYDGQVWRAATLPGVSNVVTLDTEQTITAPKTLFASDVNTTPLRLRFFGDRNPTTASLMLVEYLGVNGASPPRRTFELNERGMVRITSPEEPQVMLRLRADPAQTADAFQLTDLSNNPRMWIDILGRVRAPNISAVPPFSVAGELSTGTGNVRWYNDTGQPLTLRSVRASVGTSPQGSPVVVDVNVNGSSVWTSPAAQPTIPANGVTSGAVTPNTSTIPAGGYLTVDIDAVGSTSPGGDLTVQILAY